MHTAIYGLDDVPARTRQLQSIGVDGVFSFEGPHDVFAPLVLASTVSNVDLMTNVAIAFPRNPIHLAHAANDLQLLSGGRFTLGLGTQVRPQIERRFGADFDHPVERMAEVIGALRAIFSCWNDGTRLDFRGDFFQHTLMTPMFSPGPNPFGPPPIYLGALGPRLTRLAAEVADGLLVMPFNTKRFFHERTLPAVQVGLDRAGRDRSALAIVPEVIVAVGRTEEELAVADAGTRFLLAFYGSTPSYRPVLDLHGWGDLHPELNTLSKQGRWAEMSALIDDTMLATIAARGTPTEVAADITDRFGGGVTDLAFYLPYAADDETLAELVGLLHRGS
ncbi:MAG: fgd 1 [Acidimicrobiales bacterium]|nr:fgd 1 [Acidimicrobiales bacterium]